MSAVDADGHRSDVLGTLGEALAGPLAAGARTEMLAVDTLGRVTLAPGLWEPMLLVAPLGNVGETALVVGARTGGDSLAPVTFAPWTEKGAFVPLHRPAVPAGRETLTAIEVELSATLGGADMPAAEIREHVAVQLLCGSFGRLYYLLHAETPRIRRLLRQVENARALVHPGGAQGAMLDRIGKELAVPRFSDRIAVAGGQIVTEEAREADADYRRRLGLYRPFLMSTRGHVERALNAGQPPGNPRFHILEEDNAFQIALRLVSVSGDAAAARDQRHNYQRYLRDTVLVDPTVNVPAVRRLPSARRQQENAQRQRLRNFLVFGGASRAMAPALAAALDRAAIAAAALGVSLTLDVARAQQDDNGSRWELGLAAELGVPEQAKLDELADRVRDTALGAIGDRRARSLVARLAQSLPAGGPDVAWLLRAAGMRTVHPLAAGRLLVSHFSTEGLVIEGGGDLTHGSAQGAPFTAALLAPNDEATNAALAFALAGGEGGWPDGAPPWQRVAPPGVDATVAGLGPAPAALANGLRALGFATDFDAAHFRQALSRYPHGIFALLHLDAAFSTALENQQREQWDRFGLIVEQLARSGVASAVLMRDADERLTLVTSAIALPLLSPNLAARRTSGFVWRALPVTDGRHQVRGSGSRAMYTGREGIGALAVVSYARRGLTDPFEYRVTAAEGVTLDIAAYEFLMNTLRHLTPAGVQVNTWDVRRRNVVLDPGLGPAPLPPRLTRAFRPFRRSRFAGADAPAPPPAES